MNAADLTGSQYRNAERVLAALRAATPDGLTPAAVARTVDVDTAVARELLRWLVAHRYAHTTGYGAWRRYHAGRRTR